MASKETIKCRAAICWEPGKPLTIEQIEVQPPKSGEVRIKVIANSICHTDLHVYTGHINTASSIQVEFPCILGHEATGVVESIGDGVKCVTVGDFVAAFCTGGCQECDYCKNPKTNLCLKRRFDETRMTDQTTRFTLNGKPVYYFLGISGLSEYTVVSEMQVAKINPEARMDRACLFGCGFTTGYGSAVNLAQVHKGSTVAVWGLGSIGLAAVYGAKIAGAANIIGIDTNDKKFEVAKKFGCNQFLNPFTVKVNSKTISEVLKAMTNGIGLDYAFECVGVLAATEDGFASLAPWGKLVQVGVAPNGEITMSPNEFLTGKSIVGGILGGYKCKEAIPKLVEDYMNGKIDVEDFFSGAVKLDTVDEAFRSLQRGEVLRTVVLF